jgi:hypothetical protein
LCAKSGPPGAVKNMPGWFDGDDCPCVHAWLMMAIGRYGLLLP